MNQQKIDILKAAALFINEKGQLLISKNKGASKWTIIGGTIEQGEDPLECLKREMREELNVEVEINAVMYKESPVFPAANDPGKTVKQYYYFCKLLGLPKPQEDINLIYWLSKADVEAGKFDFSTATREFLLPALINDKFLL